MILTKKRQIFGKTWRSYCALLCAGVLAGCAISYSDAPYTEEQKNRQVIDQETGKGIPEVLVAFLWDKTFSTALAGSVTECVHVSLLRSDAQGRYVIPSYRGRVGMKAAIYKPGYTRLNDPVAEKHGRDYMKPFRGTAEERFEELGRNFTPLNCGDDERKNILDLYESVYQEARSMAKTEKDFSKAESFLFDYEYYKYGEKEAQRRRVDRRKQSEQERREK